MTLPARSLIPSPGRSRKSQATVTAKMTLRFPVAQPRLIAQSQSARWLIRILRSQDRRRTAGGDGVRHSVEEKYAKDHRWNVRCFRSDLRHPLVRGSQAHE